MRDVVLTSIFEWLCLQTVVDSGTNIPPIAEGHVQIKKLSIHKWKDSSVNYFFPFGECGTCFISNF